MQIFVIEKLRKIDNFGCNTTIELNIGYTFGAKAFYKTRLAINFQQKFLSRSLLKPNNSSLIYNQILFISFYIAILCMYSPQFVKETTYPCLSSQPLALERTQK